MNSTYKNNLGIKRMWERNELEKSFKYKLIFELVNFTGKLSNISKRRLQVARL